MCQRNGNVHEQTGLPGTQAPQKERPFLTSLQRPGHTGPAMVKWYENDRLLATTKRDFQDPKAQAIPTALKAISSHNHQVFTQPGNGKVEVYWNGQLVTTLHFVVDKYAQK